MAWQANRGGLRKGGAKKLNWGEMDSETQKATAMNIDPNEIPEEALEIRDQLLAAVREMQGVAKRMQAYFKQGEKPPKELYDELDVIGEKVEEIQRQIKGE